MSRCSLIPLLCLLPAALPAVEIVIMMPEVREEALDKARGMIDRAAPSFSARLEALDDPFMAEVPEAPAVADNAGAQIDEPVARRLSRQEVLASVARSLQPTGSLIMGTAKKLNLGRGTMLSVGAVIPVRIQEEVYSVRLADLDNDTYTLEYEGLTLTKPFRDDRRRGQLRFDSVVKTPTPHAR